MSLEKIIDEIYKCNRCGICREKVHEGTGTYRVCPPYDIYGFESHTARGHALIARAILDGRLEYSKKFGERIYRCLTCGSCTENCPANVDNPKIVRALREELNAKGFGPPEALKEIISNIESDHNIFDLQDDRTKWANGLGLSKKGKSLYFAGCYA